MMISEDKKEEIREAADLVELVGDYVRLKRSGSGFAGLCPFHDEKTPSFHVTPRLGIYKCFGCGASGDIFSFVMEMEGVGFSEAMRTLAERYGVRLPEQNSADDGRHKEIEGIYHALRFSALFFFRQLRESGEAADARKYLEGRGYDEKIIRHFGLGYAPSGGDVLLKAAKTEGIEEEYLLKADLVKPGRNHDGLYDTFRGRLIFPLFNPSGKVIAFAGRVLGNRKTAKYINSAQTAVYNKSSVVYGVNFSKNDIRKEEEVILVEGYTDVITMIARGIGNVVASGGTALTPRQIDILQRYGKKIVMIYDSDNAGRAAMKRGMKIALAGGMDVDLLELPDREDPDSFVKKFGRNSFVELKKKESLDFVSFSIEQAEKHDAMEHPSDRTRVIAGVLESIAEMPDSLTRQVYVQHLHQKTQKYRNSSDRELFEQLDRILKKRAGKPVNRSSAPPPLPSAGRSESGIRPEESAGGGNRRPDAKRSKGEMELIRLMLQYGSGMIRYIGSLCNESLFEDEQLKMFYLDIMERHKKDEEVTMEHYAHRNPPFPELVGDVMLERYTASERHHEKTGTRFVKDKDPYKTAKSAIKPLKLNFLKRQLRELVEMTKRAGQEEKRIYINRQKRTQSEISQIERTAADDLFEDPDSGEANKAGGRGKFEYKMKEKE